MISALRSSRLCLAAVCACALLAGCGEDSASSSASSGPAVREITLGVNGDFNAQWDTVNRLIEKDHLRIRFVKYSDYSTPNRALSDGDIELNAFQTRAFLENDRERNGYRIEEIGATVITPMRIYPNPDKVRSLSDLRDGARVGIPSDRVNGARALKVLEAAGLIVCDPARGVMPDKTDITEYKVRIEIVEAESGLLANLLPDLSAAVINGGNALIAGLDKTHTALFTENLDPKVNPTVKQIVNVIAARSDKKDDPAYRRIVEAFQTPEVAKTLKDAYQGAYIPAWPGAEKLAK